MDEDIALDCRIWQTAAQELKIEYALTDAEGEIVTHSAGLADLLAASQNDLCQTALLDLCPALYGSEDMLDKVLQGRVLRWEVPKLQITGKGQQIAYVTLLVLPFTYETAPGLLLLAVDVSEQGVLEQKLTQQRNEITLIQQKLAEAHQQLERAMKH